MVQQQLVEAAHAVGQELHEVQCSLMVRKEAAGAVIGKQGGNLKQIREQCGVRLQMSAEEVEGQRECSVTGSLPQVLEALEFLANIVIQVPTPASIAGEVVTNGHGTSPMMGLAPSGPDNFARQEAGLTALDFLDPAASKRQGGFAEGAPKRQRTDDEEQVKLLIPGTAAGAVIGKQGAGLKGLRETYGVAVKVLSQNEAPQWPGVRVVTIRGEDAARRAAVNAVLGMAFPESAGGEMAAKLLVSRAAAGSLIGKSASTLKYIREQTGVRCQVEREEVLGERLVHSTGPHQQVLSAVALMFSVLETGGPDGPAEVGYNAGATGGYNAGATGGYNAGAAAGYNAVADGQLS